VHGEKLEEGGGHGGHLRWAASGRSQRVGSGGGVCHTVGLRMGPTDCRGGR
jgi:hypothetical protein